MINDVKTESTTPEQKASRNKILGIIIAVVLFFTNPNEADFAKAALEHENIDSDPLSTGLVKLVTTRDNYFVFSVFTVDTFTEKKVYIGFLKRVIIPI